MASTFCTVCGAPRIGSARTCRRCRSDFRAFDLPELAVTPTEEDRPATDPEWAADEWAVDEWDPAPLAVPEAQTLSVPGASMAPSPSVPGDSAAQSLSLPGARAAQSSPVLAWLPSAWVSKRSMPPTWFIIIAGAVLGMAVALSSQVLPHHVFQTLIPGRASLSPTAEAAIPNQPGPAVGASGAAAPTPLPTPTPKPKPTATPRPAVDRTRPTIASRTPGPNAANVSTNGIVRVVFSEAVRNVSSATVRLVNVNTGATVLTTVRYTSASRTLTIDPALLMYGRTTYRVEIMPGITDSAHNALSAVSWSFRTG